MFELLKDKEYIQRSTTGSAVALIGYVFIIIAIVSSTARADIMVKFTEGAPKDRFTVVNVGACALGPATIRLDLSGSSAGLIFDTTSAGAGVEVYQPFELVMGADVVRGTPAVTDGDTAMTLEVSDLAPNGHVAFTIDVDDTQTNGPSGQIIVRGSEIAGAVAMVGTSDGWSGAAEFDTNSQALIAYGGCLS